MKKSKANDIRLLTDAGLEIFPLKPNDKPPLNKGWQKQATADTHDALHIFRRNPEANIGVRTGAASGVIVVDVDVKDGKPGDRSLVKLQKQVGKLTDTAVVSTATGGRHLYFGYDRSDIRNSTSKIAPSIDIRGDGGYVVAPHSAIDGTKYEWVRGLVRLKALPDDLHELIATQEQAKDADKPAETLKASDPALLRAAIDHIEKSVCDWDAYDDWIAMGRAIRGALGDDGREVFHKWSAQSDRYDEGETESKWESFTPPHKSGAGSIYFWAEKSGWERPKDSSRRTMKAAEVVDALNEKLAYIQQPSGRAGILCVRDDPEYPGTNMISVARSQDVREIYANQFYRSKSGDRKSQFEFWRCHSRRRNVRRLVFLPNEPPGFNPETTDWNLWQGWGVIAHEPDDKHSWKKLRRHIRKVLARDNLEYHAYILNWFAFCVQNPGRLPEVALVLQGGEGAGKGIVLTAMVKLFGRHGQPLYSPQQVVGKFNAHMKDNLFAFADEAFFAGDPASGRMLKTLITERTRQIEGKFADIIKVPNYSKLAMSSNDSWIVPADLDARRFAIFKVSDEYRGNLGYFNAIGHQLENGGYEAMLWDLQHRDISQFDPRNFPQTSALLDQKMLTWDVTTQWLFERLCIGSLNDSEDKWTGVVFRNTLFDLIAVRTPAQHDKRALEMKISMALRRVCPNIGKDRRLVKNVIAGGNQQQAYTFLFPSLKECRSSFAAAMRTDSLKIDWDTGELKEKAS